MTGDCDPQRCLERFWGSPESAMGEQKSLRMSTKGTKEEQSNTVCFYWFILKKVGQEV